MTNKKAVLRYSQSGVEFVNGQASFLNENWWIYLMVVVVAVVLVSRS
jgi:hypothetical protein